MFEFLWWDLHSLKAGQVVEVDIATAVNVKLLSYNNFTLYRNGGIHRFIGGFAQSTPYRIEVPCDGDWILVVDLTEPHTALLGYMKVNNIKIIPPAANSNEQPKVITIPPEEATAEEASENFDVFLSHATEDKKDIAFPLKNELEKFGLKVWIDIEKSSDLSTGGLRKEIDSAIYNSRYAVIILSPDFMRKPWTNREFDGITAMEMAKRQTLLCVWHNVTHNDVLSYSPPLSMKFARETMKCPIQEIAKEFNSIITAPKKEVSTKT